MDHIEFAKACATFKATWDTLHKDRLVFGLQIDCPLFSDKSTLGLQMSWINLRQLFPDIPLEETERDGDDYPIERSVTVEGCRVFALVSRQTLENEKEGKSDDM